MNIETILLLIPLLPLIGCLIAGLLRHQVGRAGAHWVTILAVAGSFLMSTYVAWEVFFNDLQVVYADLPEDLVERTCVGGVLPG